MAAAITLKVDPAKLRTTASNFSTLRGDIKRKTQDMMNLVNKLNGATWTGTAQQAYVSKFRQLQTDMTEIEIKLNEHTTDLLEIANLYERSDRSNADAANRLGTDFVQLF